MKNLTLGIWATIVLKIWSYKMCVEVQSTETWNFEQQVSMKKQVIGDGIFSKLLVSLFNSACFAKYKTINQPSKKITALILYLPNLEIFSGPM